MTDPYIAHPMLDPAVAVELTMREREALMTGPDWERGVDRLLALPETFPLGRCQ